MFATNPFSILAETVPSIVMQGFVVLMVLLIVAGTLLDIIHKKNVKYFFENAKKAKKNATKELSTGERIAVVSKTIQSLNLEGRWDANLFLVLFIVSNLVLFGGVYWSKFAHMFYKPGAAIQKNLAEADGSRDNLPPPADAPEQFGLGIKREQPKHY